MTLEQQVCSLGLAKRLRELGVEKESLFTWVTSPVNGVCYILGTSLMRDKHNVSPWFRAFTVAELGELMKGHGMGISAYSQMMSKWWISGGEWIVEKQKYSHLIEENTEADARAKMLIYLIEKGLISNDPNNR